MIEEICLYIREYILNTEERDANVTYTKDSNNLYHFSEYKLDGYSGNYMVYAVIDINTYRIFVTKEDLKSGINNIIRKNKISKFLND